ncbi:MAG TPA: glycogen synthase GlgA [Pseudorhizobium sp.]|nr:glycogen synthase GlgA [Pseudorhizobium sp.]
MNVLSVASEIYPLIKTGGLADVAGALPLALRQHGIRTRTLVPGYPAILKSVGGLAPCLALDDLLGQPATILEGQHEGLDLLVLDIPSLFDRPGGPYLGEDGQDHPDNWRRFAALSKAGAEIALGRLEGWRPDLVHLHDWQTGLLPAYLRYAERAAPPSLMTIHNIAFQGRYGVDIFPYLGLPPDAYSIEGIEYWGGIGYLKAGVQAATAISTVSPTYAEEILTGEFGMGMEGVLASRAGDLHGIVNGIDPDVWDPARDPLINSNYTVSTIKNRQRNKRDVAERFGLEHGDGSLFCVVSRLTGQKGMDLLAECTGNLVAQGGRLAVLGSGEHWLEEAFRHAAAHHPGRIAIITGYDEPLSHLMQAGSDAILIPSRFEPCGLTQLYGLRYGCIPIVTRTGGLNDTVIDANPAALAAKVATGVSFGPTTADGLRRALRRTFRLYADQKVWLGMQKQGMKSDVSWNKSAGVYADLYSRLTMKGH